MEILDHYGIDCTGKKAVVIGRSLVVGKPAAMMLIKKMQQLLYVIQELLICYLLQEKQTSLSLRLPCRCCRR